MATVLTVHVVETIWTRRRDGGAVAPYLVIDHNGQQQQTEVAQASTATTAWNQKASFPYAPTSDLVVMAFDAGRHGGIFLGQAVVDVAAMLQEGRLHAAAPLTSSAGATIGHVAFDVELSTTSKTLAASLGIPGLTLNSPSGKQSSKNHGLTDAARSTSSGFLLDDHLSISLPLRMQDSVQTGYIRQQLQQPGQLMLRLSNTNIQADSAGDGSPMKRGQKLGSLGQMLGLNMHRSRTSEGNASSPANPATPGTTAAAATSSIDSFADFAGGPGPLLARRSMLRSSQSSFNGPTAPLMTASMTATHAAVLQEAFVTSAAGAAAGAVSAAVGEAAAAAGAAAESSSRPGSPVPAEQQQRSGHGHASNAYSAAPSSTSSGISDAMTEGTAGRANRQTETGSPVAAAGRDRPASPQPSQLNRNSPSHVLRSSLSVVTPKAVEARLSPLRSNRMKLQLAPRPTSISPERKRLQQQQQIERDLERLHQLAVQEAAANPTLRDGLAGGDSQGQLDSDVEDSDSSDDDRLLQEFEAADAAGKEAILYRQLMLQQAERKAGSAQLLKLLATQQHQEALHDSQLLATLASMSPGSSPRHHPNDRAITQSPGGRYYPDIPQFASPDGRPSSRQQLAATGPSSRQVNGGMGLGSSGGGSSQNTPSSGPKRHYYPSIPAFAGGPVTDQHHQQQGQQQQVANNRKQWVLPKQAAAAAAAVIRSGEERSVNSDLWQSCESGSEAATPTSYAADSAGRSKGSRHSKAADAAGDAASTNAKRHPGKLSRLHHTGGGAGSSSSPKDIKSYPVDDATLDSAREHDSEGGATEQPSAMQQDAAGERARYFTGNSSPAQGGKVDRWYDRYMYNTAAYPEQESVFPARAVVVAPSAPIA